MGTTSDKLTYLNTTKTKIKDAINLANTNITNETFRQYESKIKQALINTMNDKWGTWDNFEKVTGTGEILNLNPTSEAPMKIDLKGNTSQYSTTGKNLLNNPITSQTISGLTITRKEDGSLVLNGTTTQAVSLFTPIVGKLSLEAGTYIHSVKNMQSGLYLSLDNIGDTMCSPSQSASRTFTLSAANQYTNYVLYIDSNKTFNNFVIEPMIRLSTITDDTYEPYTGGSPAPNPSYPEPVNVVSGDNTIEVVGKNLCNKIELQNSNNIRYFFDKSVQQTIKLSTILNVDVLSNSLYLAIDGTNYGNVGTISGTANTRISTTITFSNATFEAIKKSNECYLTLYKSQAGFTLPTNGMIENGNTMTDYEPYQSQTYPIYLGVLGKNLFTSKVEQGAISERPGYSYDDCKTDNTTRIRVKDLIRLDTTKSYTISIGTDYEYVIQGFNSDKKLYSIEQGSWKSVATTLTNVPYIAIAIRNTSNTTITPSEINNAKIMIEVGTSASTYEAPNPLELCKIGDYQDEVLKNTGKNLIDSVEYNRSVSNTGTIQNGSTYLGINDYVTIQPNTTYTISFEHDISGAKLYIGYKDINGNFISRESYSTTRTFTSLENAYYMFPYLNKSGNTFDTIGGWVQLEKGSTATSYEPYGTGWYIKKQIGKVVLDGTNILFDSKSGTTNNIMYSTTVISDIVKPSSGSIVSDILSNNFISKTPNTMYLNNTIGIGVNTNGTIACGFGLSSTLTTKELANTWLSTHNLIVYYVLATPQYITITDTELISQLDNIQSAMSYKGQTNIMQVPYDKPFILDATLLKEI